MHLQEKLPGIKVLHRALLSLVRDKGLCWRNIESTLFPANLLCETFPASLPPLKNILLANGKAGIEFCVPHILFRKEISIFHISSEHLNTFL